MAMVSSPAQLLLGNEAIGMTKRFLQGIAVNQDTLARHVIEAVGPGGHFLQQRHTLDHFRGELWRSELLTRQPYGIWQAAGGKDMAERIQEKLVEIVETHRVPDLPEGVTAAVERLQREGEAELTAGRK
jgi:trimethylamine--corrinoid protein Co-methyltransferase